MQRTSNLEAGREQLRLFEPAIQPVNATSLIPKSQVNLQTEQSEPVQKVGPQSDHSTVVNRVFHRLCSKCQREPAIPGLDALRCADCDLIRGSAV